MENIMKLIYTAQEIKYLNDYFKQNSEILDKEEFVNGVLEIIQRTPAMYKSFIACYESGKYLQPGYLTEINICATLAQKFHLTYDTNIVELNLRHQYSNERIFLKEYGGCGMSDIKFIDENGKTITIEVKEPLSLGGDFDLGITEEGKLFPKIATNREFPEAAKKILDEFNAVDSIFNHLGHNIPLSNTNYLQSILNSYLGDKQIDYIATYSKDSELIYFPISELINHVDFKGSEIRTAGKNKVNVYTPNAFKKAMNDIGCIIEANNIVSIPKNAVGYRTARGSNGRITGIKINSIFYFEIGDIINEDEQFYYANISRGKQLKQGISVHLNLK